MQRRTTVVAKGVGIGLQLFLQQGVHLALGRQNRLKLIALFFQLVLLAADLHLFQSGEMAQFQFEDRFGLGFADAKARHQGRLRFVLGTNDLNHFVNVEERHQQTFEDMQALKHFLQTMVQTTAHRIAAEGQPFGEDLQQVFHRRTTVQTNHVQVDAVAFFQIGSGEQVVHHLLHVHAVRARHDHQTGRVFVVRFVAQVVHHRQLFIAHLGGNLLQHLRTGHLVRQRGDHHGAILFIPHRAHAHGATAVLVDFADFRTRGDDLGFGRIVRPLHDLQQIVQRGFWLLNQGDGRFRHFTQVVRRNVRRHAHGDTGRAVQQDVRQTRRQHFRLLHRTVEVWHPVDRPLPQLAQQHFGIFRQAGFGITHCRKGFRIVRRPPVPLAIHQRIAIRERLGHQHHRFIAGAVAVRMVFTQHVADGTGGFLKLGGSIQPQFGHRIDDAALNGLQAIPDKRQRPVHDDVHGVVQVGVFREFM